MSGLLCHCNWQNYSGSIQCLSIIIVYVNNKKTALNKNIQFATRWLLLVVFYHFHSIHAMWWKIKRKRKERIFLLLRFQQPDLDWLIRLLRNRRPLSPCFISLSYSKSQFLADCCACCWQYVTPIKSVECRLQYPWDISTWPLSFSLLSSFFLLSSSFLSPSVKHMNNRINWKTKYSSRWWSDTWVVAWKQTGLLVIYWGHFILEAYRGPLYFSVCEWVQLCVCVCLSGSCYTTTHHCFYLIFILSLDLPPPHFGWGVWVCVLQL